MPDEIQTPSGADCVALVRLTSKDEAEVLAAPGETCERVPAVSLRWLLEQGLVKTIAQVAAEAKAAAASQGLPDGAPSLEMIQEDADGESLER
jgi:hypothetical protein